MKKLLSLVLCSTLILSLAACGKKQEAPAAVNSSNAPVSTQATEVEDKDKAEREAYLASNELIKTLVFSCATTTKAYNETEIPQAYWVKHFCAELEKRTNGRYKVDLYLDGQLASSTAEVVSGVQNGSIDIAGQSAGNLGEYSNGLAELNVPFLFDSHEQVHNFLAGEVGKEMMARFEEDVPNIHPLSFDSGGFRMITNNKKEIHSPDDLSGMKMRTMADEIQMATFKACGALISNISMKELFTALQQKVVDGQENPPRNIYNYGFAEVQDYLTVSKHSFSATLYFMNKKTWDSINPIDQEIITELVKECSAVTFIQNAKAENLQLDILKKDFKHVNELTDEEMDSFRALMLTEVWPQCEEIMGAERWKRCQDEIANLKGEQKIPEYPISF